jgi:hypothetical protein
MRDGIYRSLPMSRRWKSLFKMCEREAERERYAPKVAQRAIETDFRQGIGTGFLRRLEAAVETALLQLPGVRALPAQADLGGSNTAIERQLLANAAGMLVTSDGATARDIMQEALSQTVHHQRNAILREARRHAFENGVNGRATAAALATAVGHIDPAETARRLLERAPAHRGPLRPEVELDEAL